MTTNSPSAEIELLRKRLAEIDQERQILAQRLAELETAERDVSTSASTVVSANQAAPPTVTNDSPPSEKIALFRRLFGGRTDVFPVRWENPKSGRSGYAPACANEWVRGVCGKPQVKCGDCPHQNFIPVTSEVIECHLRGEDWVRPNGSGNTFIAGVYPLLFDDTSAFLAIDFDGESWIQDALAFVATCREVGVPCALERSRSGNGGHVWLFFSEPLAAAEARRLGSLLLTRTMNQRPEIGFNSYDRLFPSQDTMPSGGFGNLIALPLQRRAREAGNSLFVDENLQPREDQWAYLSSLRQLSAAEISNLILRIEAEIPDGVTGVRLPVDDENAAKPWKMTPSRRAKRPAVADPLPSEIEIVLADQIYVDRTDLPPSMTAQIIRTAGFSKPGVLSRSSHATLDLRQAANNLLRRAS